MPAPSNPPPFPVDQLAADHAVLEGSIRWGEAEGDDALLLHSITVVLRPLDIGDVHDSAPKLRLHSIRFPVRSWAELAGHSYRFPNVVRLVEADGESNPIFDIYGSLRIGDSYHPVVPDLLRFEGAEGCRLDMHVEALVRAVDTPPSFEPAHFTLDTELSVGAVQVLGDMATSRCPSVEEATELIHRLLDEDRYEPPQPKDGCTVVAPRCAE